MVNASPKLAWPLVVFDWDGTVMDSVAVIAHALRQACIDLQQPDCGEGVAREVIGLGIIPATEKLAPQLDRSRYAAFSEAYRTHYHAASDTVVLFDGIPELLHRLQREGALLAVATGKSRRELDRVLGVTGLGPLFDVTRCADETFSKPHPAMLHEIVDRLGVTPLDGVMVGDTIHDIQMAENAGMASIGVEYGAHDPERLRASSAVASCSTVADLERALFL